MACKTIMYVFLRFFQNPKKHDFLRFFELLYTFSRTLVSPTQFICDIVHHSAFITSAVLRCDTLLLRRQQ